MTGAGGRFEEGIKERIGIAVFAHRHRAAAAAEGRFAALPAFGAAEIGECVGIGPAGKPGGRPAVVVGAVPAHPRHGIDRRRTPDHAASCTLDRTTVEILLRLGEVAPVVQAFAENAAPAKRDVDPGIAIPVASLEQQHAGARGFRQPVGEHAAGRTRTDDHIVKACAFAHGGLPLSLLPWRCGRTRARSDARAMPRCRVWAAARTGRPHSDAPPARARCRR